MKLSKENRRAIKKIIKEFPDDEDTKGLTETQQIEYLANYYISTYIEMFFCDGKNYLYRD